MEWATVQHLDLRHVGRGQKPLQPHAAAFHPSQALIAAAIGNYIIGMTLIFFHDNPYTEHSFTARSAVADLVLMLIFSNSCGLLNNFFVL